MRGTKVIALIIGLGIISILSAMANEQQYLDDGYYNVTWVSSNFNGEVPHEVADNDYPTTWWMNKVYYDSTGFNSLGTMRALNDSFNIMGMDRLYNLKAMANLMKGHIINIVDIEIPTYLGNRTGNIAYIDVGSKHYAYGEVNLDCHELIAFLAKDDCLDLLSTLKVEEPRHPIPN